MNNLKTAVIISISSDIGTAMANRWVEEGWTVLGTYRSVSPALEALKAKGVETIQCDLADEHSVTQACEELQQKGKNWDVLMSCSGNQNPINSFENCNFKEWETSIEINLLRQLQIIHALLPSRNLQGSIEPCVLTFAGGGTNNATQNYSAYTISKIGLIKMMELLDAEISNTRFFIVGPGWVKTKIHEATLHAGKTAGDSYQQTIAKLEGNDCTPMKDVFDCCDWLVQTPRETVSGRNFSVVYDEWGNPELEDQLNKNFNMYKLRRSGNEWKSKSRRG